MFIAALRALVVCSMLYGCGGESGTTSETLAPEPSQLLPADYLDYAPYARTGLGAFSGGTWTTSTIGHKHYIRWTGLDGRISDEEFEIRINPVDGREWIFLCAYLDPKAGRRYVIEVDSAVIQWPDGHLEDITSRPDVTCHPYAMRYPPLAYTLIVRAKTHNDPNDCATQSDPAACNARTQPFFWKVFYTGPAAVLNTCWHQDGQRSRLAFRQAEAYWDPHGGWSQASGGILGPDGMPTGESVTLGRYQTIGYMAGFGWTFEQTADPLNRDPLQRAHWISCLSSAIFQ